MRDLVVREALEQVAEEAAEAFRALVRGGEEIPYEVVEPGANSPLVQYAPLTAHFVRDHASALAELESFGPAAAALAAAEVAVPYLEEMGVPVPPDPSLAAERAILAFLCRLWEGSTDFSLEPSRVQAAMLELDACTEVGSDEVEIVVPIVGMRMPVTRLTLTSATLIRADAVDVPAEARRVEGTGRANWEPQYVAVARCSVEPTQEDGDDPLAARFHHLITTLRLFKPGGVALGAHAWIRTPGGRWRRISTGVAASRPGGYTLADSELAELMAFSRALDRRPARARALGRAISRFEAGLERPAVLEALNDYMLSLRFLLEGGGPAETGLAMRIVALCAEPRERGSLKEIVDQALLLERELWSGEPSGGSDGPPAAEVVAVIEDCTRAILKDAAVGHLGGDLRATADEILLADGLVSGEASVEVRGGTSEWEPALEAEIVPPESDEHEPVIRDERPANRQAFGYDPGPETKPVANSEEIPEAAKDSSAGAENIPHMHEPAPAGSVQNPSRPRPIEAIVGPPPTPTRPSAPDEPRYGREEPKLPVSEPSQGVVGATDDWLAATGGGETLDFPTGDGALRVLDERPAQREAIRNRVSNLFPRPATTEWEVAEMDYDRRKRRLTA